MSSEQGSKLDLDKSCNNLQIDRVNSMAGIKWQGNNQTIEDELMPDLLKLSSKGKNPNIFSYRKPNEQDKQLLADAKLVANQPRRASAGGP